jgi:uncharacterized radical SAM protein YgiQ
MSTPALTQPAFLPMSRHECDALGWDELDIVIVTGDAYVDHPAFGAALVGRALVDAGFRVGVIAQPDWHTDVDFEALGRPRLFFGVTAGNMDSMVNHYTAQRKIRSNDAYSPNGHTALRPDRATLAYCNALRRTFKGVPIVIGGIEASLRRIPHYDYWSDKVRNSLLFDSKANMLIYGMAEKTIVVVARALRDGRMIESLSDVPGTVVAVSQPEGPEPALLPPWEDVREPEGFYAMSKAFHTSFRNTTLYQPFAGRFLRHNPPPASESSKMLDRLYALPFARAPHPRYNGTEIPAFVQIENSITTHRGCVGGCTFCALGYHQGKLIRSRSADSVVAEVRALAAQPGFGGTISDVGGPSANMYGMHCTASRPKTCRRASCLFPEICAKLDASHEHLRTLLRRCREVDGVQHVFVASGVRFDLALRDEDYVRDLVLYHTGGRLKIAPEHVSPDVLRLMSKPDKSVYEAFFKMFRRISCAEKMPHQVVPYIMVGHPGTTMQDAVELVRHLHRHNLHLEQIQEFTPTPMTISTCMYFTGVDFETGAPIHVPKGREVRLQKALAQWFVPANRKYAVEALREANALHMMSELYGQDARPDDRGHRQYLDQRRRQH